MADKTRIEWTEATWNPITGCSLASPGCTNCYAMQLAGTRMKHHASRKGLTRESGGRPKWTGEVRFNREWLDQPLRWKRPRMIFVCAHGDLFHENVPDEWIDEVFAVMALCPQHTFQVLTKRSARMREYLSGNCAANYVAVDPEGKFKAQEAWPLPNVWLGVSVEDQQRADERIPDLLATPAAVRWLSCEPLLGAVDLTAIQAPRYCAEDHETDWKFNSLIHGSDCYWYDCGDGFTDGGDGPYREHGIDWVVAGGESGPGARPMHSDWVRSLRDQCAADDVPFFFKQWGQWAPVDDDTPEGTPVTDVMPDGMRVVHGNTLTALMASIGKKAAGRLLDGVEHDGMPP